MKTLKNWKLQNQSAHHIELLVDGQHSLCLYILEENMFRVLLKRKGVLSLDRTWSIAPEKDVPWEGRHREDISGFSGNDSNLLIVFYVQIMPDDLVMQLHRF